METSYLKEIGLTESEAKVYLALLELGESTRGDIVDKAGIAGSKVYELLEKLQVKGFVSIHIEKRVKHFKATNPKQILRYLEERKKRIFELEEKAHAFLPALTTLFESSAEEQEVELLTGLKGAEIVFHDQVDAMRRGEICYVIGGTKGFAEEALQAFFVKIHRLRQQKGVRTRMLYNESQRGIVMQLYSARQFSTVQVRFLQSTSPVAINIYHDRTIIIVFGKKISLVSVKSKEVANSFLEYFNILWAQATP